MADESFVDLPKSARRAFPPTRQRRPINKRDVASLTIKVRPKKPFAELRALVEQIYATPRQGRTYLTRTDIAERHGASPQDLQAIADLASRHRLIASRPRPEERSIVLTGTLDNLLAVFPADLAQCRVGHTSYRGRQGTIQVPSSVAGIVTGVFGYDTHPKQRARRGMARAGTGAAAGVAANVYAQRYNFPNEHDGKALDGTGCCIGFVELGGNYRASDLQTYCQLAGTPMPQVFCSPPARSVTAPDDVDDGDAEVMLDIEVAAATAPGASLSLYFDEHTEIGLLNAVNAAVHDRARNIGVLSISWGGPECRLTAQAREEFCKTFTEAAGLGIFVCAASGDHGVADIDAADWDNVIHVDYPAADPRVLGCGGTQIDTRSGQEVVWNDGTPFDMTSQSGGWATGGGISVDQDVPPYQTNVALPATLDPSGKKGRGVPDIAMIAKDHLAVVNGAQISSLGTSAVAPMMAGLAARLTQASGQNIGMLHALLYGTPGLCKPITSGNNGIDGNPIGYQASPDAAWNACTGLGTPDGKAILRALLPAEV